MKCKAKLLNIYYQSVAEQVHEQYFSQPNIENYFSFPIAYQLLLLLSC